MYRIGIDAKRYFFNNTGLGKYATNLLRCLHPPYLNENVKLVLYTPKRPKDFEENLSFNRTKITTPRYPLPFWRSLGMIQDINKDSLDLFHGISHEIPLELLQRFHCPTIVTMHDLIFVRYPEMFPVIDRTFYYLKYKSSAQKATGIIAVGQQTKNDLVHFWNIPKEKIEIIHQSIDPIFFTTYENFQQEKLHSSKGNTSRAYPRDYILMVGTVSKRKNMLLALKAFAANKNLQKDFDLVIIGNASGIHVEYKKECEDFIRKNSLKATILSDVNDQQLLNYYLHARAFLYPSLFEGFGLPIVEAMALGCMTIISRGCGLEDASYSDPLQVDPKESEDLSEVLEKACYDEELRKKHISLGLEHARRFHPDKIAPQLWDYYKRFLSLHH